MAPYAGMRSLAFPTLTAALKRMPAALPRALLPPLLAALAGVDAPLGSQHKVRLLLWGWLLWVYFAMCVCFCGCVFYGTRCLGSDARAAALQPACMSVWGWGRCTLATSTQIEAGLLLNPTPPDCNAGCTHQQGSTAAAGTRRPGVCLL